MVSVKHAFESGKGDGPDSTRVRPSNWNAEHDVLIEDDGVVLGRLAGAGPGAPQEIPMSALLPAGIILPYGGGTPPEGFILCYGQSLLRSEHPALFAAIGTGWGQGDTPGSTFAVPDLRGVVPAGKSNMGGSDRGNLPGGATLGAFIGQATQIYALTGSGTAFTNGLGGTAFTAGLVTTGPSGLQTYSGGGNTAASPSHSHSIADNVSIQVAGNAAVNISGVTDTRTNVQPSGIVNYIIKT